MADAEQIESYRRAGRIAADALRFGKGLIKKDAAVLEVCDKIEEKIKSLGGDIAFPAQVSLNDTAAHFCPEEDDKTRFIDQVVCLDIGVHVDGFIGDNACSVDLSGSNAELIRASKDALDSAIKIIRPGVTLGQVGKTIQETIESYGFKPVANLSGHGLDHLNIHSSPSVPNIGNDDETELTENQVIAIEPFASTGSGLITEKGEPSVFMMHGRKSVRTGFVRDILKKVTAYEGLPFTSRWLTRQFSTSQVRYALDQFKQLGIMKEYPPLVERANGLVSQAEKTVLVKERPEILTPWDAE